MEGMRPSTLKAGLKSRLHLKRSIDGELKPNPKSVAIGNAVHCILANELEDRYCVMPPFELDPQNCTATGKESTSKNTLFFKESAELWRLEHADKEELSEVQVHTASLIANRVRDRFHDLLDASEQEVVVVGTIAGLLMKTRLDGVHFGSGMIWDLKTSASITQKTFYRIFDTLGYGFSATVHVELMRQNGFDCREYALICAEAQDDYDVRKLTLPFNIMENALPKVEQIAAQYLECMKTGIWPGLPDDILETPNWDMAEKELDWGEEEEEMP